jgi:hypothetical protein
MDLAEHKARHEFLHGCLDELLADFLRHNGGMMPSTTSLMEFMQWSFEQTKNPREVEVDHPLAQLSVRGLQ